MLRYTANYAYTNHNFVIQNLNGDRINNHFTAPVCVLKNILQRGTPTLMSRYLQSKLGKIQDHPEFKLPLPLISNAPPHWMRTIGGDEKKNYYPAKTFFYEVIPHYLSEYRQILQLMLPEASINDITQVEVDDFIDQRVDFFLPQANLVIEIDGQHHKRQDRTRINDTIRDQHLAAFGFVTVRSRRRHVSTALLRSLLALLISVGEIRRPINLSEIMDRVRVLMPAKNIILKSRAISSSYCLLRGITAVLNSPLRSRGISTWTSPTPLRANPRP